MSKEITSNELAEILGISKRRVNQIADEGIVFQREISGNFKMVECVEQYYANKFSEEDYKVKYNEEHALLEKAKREKAELEVGKMKNELHASEDVEMVMTGMLVNFKNRILAIPSKLAPQIVGIKNINKINELTDEELRDALIELSEYDPEMFVLDG